MITPNFRNVYAFGFGNIFTDTWVPAPAWAGTGNLIDGTPANAVYYWHVQIVPESEIYLDEAALEAILAIPTIARRDEELARVCTMAVADGTSILNGSSRRYGSTLKVRIRWGDGPSRYRTIEFDLGAGVDIILPPSRYIEGHLLVPAAPQGDGIAVPELISTTKRSGFISNVTARWDCLGSPPTLRENSVRWTDTRYLRLGQANQTIITRKRTTHRISAVASSAIGNLRLQWDRDPPSANLPSILNFGQFPVGTYTPTPPGGNQIIIADIPGPTNVIAYTMPVNIEEQYISVIQELTL